jgi:hypothetical protein
LRQKRAFDASHAALLPLKKGGKAKASFYLFRPVDCIYGRCGKNYRGVAGWAIYTLISEPGSQIDKFEAILFAIVMAAIAPQLLAFIKTKK